MKIFFDTSSLFKLYHKEKETEELMEFISTNAIRKIYLADITRVEFSSVVWKKCRMSEISETIAEYLIGKFDGDCSKFTFVRETSALKTEAKKLIAKYWKDGLRTLDSIQLASALSVKEEIKYFFTSDKLLYSIANKEGVTAK